MAKLLGCRVCMIDLARIELADGTVALICSACDVVGLEHEVGQGARLWAAGRAFDRTPPSRRVGARPRRGALGN